MKEKEKNNLNRLTSLIRRIQGKEEAIQSTDFPPQQDETPQPNDTARPPQTFLIIGLGNPGREYAENRHNIGFMLVDRLADRLGVSFSRVQHKALVTDGRYEGHKIILAKPQTYMNESGKSVGALAKFYKVPLENILVVFDEMDITFGAIRIRPKGGSSGQKGMKSIIQSLGNQQGFPRMRLGIGRPPGRMPPPAYLLQDFSDDEMTEVNARLDDAVDAVLTFVTKGLDMAMNRYNGM